MKHPAVENWIAKQIKRAGELRSALPPLEAEKRKPGRAGAAGAFDREIDRTQKELDRVEADIAQRARQLPRYYPKI